MLSVRDFASENRLSVFGGAHGIGTGNPRIFVDVVLIRGSVVPF